MIIFFFCSVVWFLVFGGGLFGGFWLWFFGLVWVFLCMYGLAFTFRFLFVVVLCCLFGFGFTKKKTQTQHCSENFKIIPDFSLKFNTNYVFLCFSFLSRKAS